MSAGPEVTAHIDFETRSTVDLAKSGVHKYAEHHTTKVLCLGYKIGTNKTGIWRPLKGDTFPRELAEHIASGGRVVAHNMAFDRIIWNYVLRRDYPEVPELRIEQTDCTMIRALSLRLPGGLDAVCKALRLPIRKDLEGYKVMMRLCKPQKAAGQLVWNNDPALFETLYAYCVGDIEAEAPIDDILPRLHPQQQKLWWISERINDRGIAADMQAVTAAAYVVEDEGKSLALAVKHLTKGWASATQRAKLLDWLQNYGLPINDLKKHTVRDVLKTEIEYEHVRKVLELQTEANKSSTAKLKKMIARVCADSRIRGEYRFHGAGTGRWSSTGVQLHNLARPDKHFKLKHALDVFEILKFPTPQARKLLKLDYTNPMFALSHSIRPMLRADEGKVLTCADYSNIEGRFAAWFAGEEWKLDAFRAYDTITGYDAKGEPIRLGPDNYKLAFARAFGVSPDDVDDDQRQVGKVIELSAQYQSGHGGFLAMAAGYDVDITTVADVVKGAISASEWDFYAKKYDDKGAQHFGLERHEWTGVKALIEKWREANSKIKDVWKALENAAVEVVRVYDEKVKAYEADAAALLASGASPDMVADALPPVQSDLITSVGQEGGPKVHMGVWDHALWIRLPSGRKLCYKFPSLTEIDTPWGQRKPSVRVWGTDKGAFRPYHLYGGIIFENIVQGGSYDLLGDAIIRLEDAGYPIVMHTHDECAAETEPDFGSLEEFSRIMSALPQWAAGLPVSVAGWRGERYRKG